MLEPETSLNIPQNNAMSIPEHIHGVHCVIFDLDDTLAHSFSPPDPQLIFEFELLLEKIPLAILTGAGFDRVREHFLSAVSPKARLSHLYILPDSSAQAYTHKESVWTLLYNHAFTEKRRTEIVAIVEAHLRDHGWDEWPLSGERLIVREAQITIAALGVQAPRELKAAWDPERKKRASLRSALAQALPDCTVTVGGLTAIDISPEGVDKSHGVLWLARHLSCTPRDMFFVGDSFHEGGNDMQVIPTGIQWHQVAGPSETLALLRALNTSITR
ncbi:HAD-IIB family hydrolase [bacterium]|nr:HAD-IIB family hydrolase [bacterium]